MIVAVGSQSIEIDLMAAEREFLRLEGPQATGKPTAMLLDRVAGWLATKGIKQTSRTIAWQVWWAVFERIDAIREQTQVAADIAFWYGINPFGLNDEQAIGLRANLPRVRAQQTLHEGNYRETDYEAVYQLTLLATGDEQLARKAWAIAREKYQDMKTGLHRG